MPSEVMDQRRRLSSFGLASPASSFFSDELHFPTGRLVGFWKPESVPDHFGMDGMPLVSGSKSVSSSPLDNLCQAGVNSVESLELPQHYMFKDQSLNFGQEHQLMGSGKDGSLSTTSWRATEQDFGLRSDCGAQHASLSMEGNKIDMNGIRYENGLFSSSLSELFNRKLTMASNIAPIGQSVDVVDSNFDDDEPLESLAELEAQTIGNLLPDDDDLLSGVVDDIGYIARPTSGDEMDDDIFYTGGGMELEGDDNANFNRTSDFLGEETPNGQQGGLNSVFASEHPYGEHPSRTLFVRNINSNVEDSELRDLFAEYGEIRTLYTACKHRGFVMISYYDIRSARNAMRGLQNKPLRRRKLDIHFSIPKDNPTEKDVNQGTLVVFNLDSSVSNDHLRELFGAYGEIKEIRETPHKRHHKFIEFYDVRSAETALRALNRSDLGGKKIKLEPSRPGGARRLMQQLSPELEGEQEESNGCRKGSPPNNLSPGYGSIPLGTLSSNGFDSGVVQGLHSAVRQLPFLETAYNSISSSVPHSLSSPIRVTSAGNHPESSHSLGQMKFGFQGLPNFHPQSLPEYHDGLTNGMSYSSSSNISAMAINMNSRPAEALEGRFIQKVSSGSLGSHSFEHNKAFGVPGNGICPHGHHYIWNNANAYPHHHPGPMLWSNAPSFVNHAHPPPQMPGIPRAPSHMLNAVLPLHPHHVGSAPAVNPSLWDRRQPYGGDLTDSPAFHPGSLGSMGFPGSSPMHQLELASHNIFAHTRGGNCIDPSISSSHVGIASPQQRCHMFHGRNPMIPLPSSFDAPTDRVRSRRGDAAVNQADSKKQYELDIERIMRGEDLRTTLMIKNIPNKYTSKMLLVAIDENHRGTYDFIYLPIDFKNKCNVGYAFINMIDPQQIIPFFQAFNGKKWEKFNSEKVASLAYARIQGKQALIAHFQNSSLMNEDKRCRPILFHSDGPNAGDQEPFPMGVNIRSRPGRSRTAGYDENNQGSPSTSPSGAGCSSRADSGSTKGSE